MAEQNKKNVVVKIPGFNQFEFNYEFRDKPKDEQNKLIEDAIELSLSRSSRNIFDVNNNTNIAVPQGWDNVDDDEKLEYIDFYKNQLNNPDSVISKRKSGERVKAGVQSLGHGATLGLGKSVLPRVAAALGDEGAVDRGKQAQQQLDFLRGEYPLTTGASEAVGSLIPLVTGASAIAKAGAAPNLIKEGLTKGGRLRAKVATTGLGGGLYSGGITASEGVARQDPLEELTKNIATSTALGGATGGALPLAGSAVGGVGRFLKPYAEQVPVPTYQLTRGLINRFVTNPTRKLFKQDQKIIGQQGVVSNLRESVLRKFDDPAYDKDVNEMIFNQGSDLLPTELQSKVDRLKQMAPSSNKREILKQEITNDIANLDVNMKTSIVLDRLRKVGTSSTDPLGRVTDDGKIVLSNKVKDFNRQVKNANERITVDQIKPFLTPAARRFTHNTAEDRVLRPIVDDQVEQAQRGAFGSLNPLLEEDLTDINRLGVDKFLSNKINRRDGAIITSRLPTGQRVQPLARPGSVLDSPGLRNAADRLINSGNISPELTQYLNTFISRGSIKRFTNELIETGDMERFLNELSKASPKDASNFISNIGSQLLNDAPKEDLFGSTASVVRKLLAPTSRSKSLPKIDEEIINKAKPVFDSAEELKRRIDLNAEEAASLSGVSRWLNQAGRGLVGVAGAKAGAAAARIGGGPATLHAPALGAGLARTGASMLLSSSNSKIGLMMQALRDPVLFQKFLKQAIDIGPETAKQYIDNFVTVNIILAGQLTNTNEELQ